MISPTEKLDEAKGPFDLEIEMCAIASLWLLEDDSRRRQVRMMLSADSFYLGNHATLFTATAAQIDADKPADMFLVRTEMRQRDKWEEVGGDKYASEILSRIPSADHAEHYAKIVDDLYLRRLGIAVGNELSQRLMRPADEDTATDVIQQAINDAVKISHRRNRVEVFTLADIAAQFLADKESDQSPALLTGVPELDQYSGIFAFGKYTVIAGRPSMGKSTLLRWLLQLWAQAGTEVGLVAAEEDRQKIAGNYLSSISNIENARLAYKHLDDQEFTVATHAVGDLARMKWHGVDTAFSIDEVCSAVEILATEKECKVIGVDHIHLIYTGRNYDNDHREVKEVSRRLKEICKRHRIILIAAAQLSRPDKNSRIPPPPMLTDLRESGSIEEHADAVLMIHREDYYEKQRPPTHHCEVFVRKNRNGRTGGAALFEELKNQRFREPTMTEMAMWESENMP